MVLSLFRGHDAADALLYFLHLHPQYGQGVPALFFLSDQVPLMRQFLDLGFGLLKSLVTR